MFLYALLACSSATRLARVPDATRVAELANGEILVGTATGQLWLVTSFGDASLLASLGGSGVADLVSDPFGRYWARTTSGSVYVGDAWSGAAHSVGVASLLLRSCDGTQLLSSAEAGLGVSALALGVASCDSRVAGAEDGRVNGREVTGAPVVRVQAVERGVLWVDAEANAGCLECSAPLPRTGVVDAISLHLAPFVSGEVVWIDTGGTLWVAST